MNAITLQALKAFPDQLEAHYAAIPPAFRHWAPASWDGIPSEHLTAVEQVGHVRDIEIQGYHVRFRRTLEEDNPVLPQVHLDASDRNYTNADIEAAFRAFRGARAQSIALITSLTPAQFARPAVFDGYGPLTLRSLVHYLCSHDQQHLAGLQWLLGKMSAQSIVDSD